MVEVGPGGWSPHKLLAFDPFLSSVTHTHVDRNSVQRLSFLGPLIPDIRSHAGRVCRSVGRLIEIAKLHPRLLWRCCYVVQVKFKHGAAGDLGRNHQSNDGRTNQWNNLQFL